MPMRADPEAPIDGDPMTQQSPTATPRRRPHTDWPPLAFAGILTTAYVGIVVSLLFIKVPEGAESVVVPLVNRLGDVFMMAMAYLYVTTAASNRKTDLLAKAGPIDPH